MWVKPAKREIEERGYIPHVRPRGEEMAETDRPLCSSPGVGWLRFATLGLTGSGNSWYVMKKWTGAILACSCWPLQSLFYGKSIGKIWGILFMAKLLIRGGFEYLSVVKKHKTALSSRI
jgi:hypothetical protein